MKAPGADISRACTCGGGCPKCQRQAAAAQERGGPAIAPVIAAETPAPAAVADVLSSPGQALDPQARAFMEARFERDFGRVRVHADSEAASSARAMGAHAYTVGRDVVFGADRYQPTTRAGRHLLAHELAHVAQQDAVDAAATSAALPRAGGAAELEADRAAGSVAVGGGAGRLQGGQAPTLARFSDTGHHVIEEAGLAGAGYSESQRETIEQGNVERDYSQVGKIGNTALLCKPKSFGGYQPVEHFDNYVWDAVSGGWRSRGTSALGGKFVDVQETPIDYIASELNVVAMSENEADLVHLGNAFHTVEDFFAHSNFVELMQGDTSHGDTLMTGNLEGPSQSIPRILEQVTPRGAREGYHEQAEAAVASAVPGSHTQLAHDDPTTKNYTVARRLAALVIQDLGADVLSVTRAPLLQRVPLMKERVVSKVKRYLRPPDPQDKWWESLVAADAGRIDKRLEEAERRTPLTVNQCALSPLKNLEASRDSPMTLPLGVALPTTILGAQVWFQIGAGVTQPFPFEPVSGESRGGGGGDEGVGFVAGGQITGRF